MLDNIYEIGIIIRNSNFKAHCQVATFEPYTKNEMLKVFIVLKWCQWMVQHKFKAMVHTELSKLGSPNSICRFKPSK